MSLLERLIALLAAVLLLAALVRWISYDIEQTAVSHPGKETAAPIDGRK